MEEDVHDPRRQLSAAEREEIRSTLADVAQGHVIEPKPAASAQDEAMRWSDVELSLSYAADDAEMAVLKTTVVPQGYFVQLKTVDDRPVQMTITRTGDDAVYHAAATVGRFAQDHEAAQRLLHLFDRYMQAFGRKRGIESP